MNLLAIFQKELKSYFVSPIAYIVTGIFWLIAGIYLVGILLGEQGLIQQVNYGDLNNSLVQPIDVPYIFLNSFFSILGSLCLFFLPLLSMKLYVEERKRNDLRIFAVSTIYNWIIALIKLLGATTFFIFAIAPFLLYEIIIFSVVEPPIPYIVPLLAHCGLILFATAILSGGMFISSLTNNHLVAAIFTFVFVFFLWLLDMFAHNIGGFWGKVLQDVSLLESYNNLIRGIFDLSNIVLLFSYIFIGIFLTVQSIENFSFIKKNN